MPSDEYNHHARLGGAAGRATSIPAHMGQQAHEEARRNGNHWVPPAPTTAPHWMMYRAFTRGLILFGASLLLAVLIGLGLLGDWVGKGMLSTLAVVSALGRWAGVILMVLGVFNFLARRRRG